MIFVYYGDSWVKPTYISDPMAEQKRVQDKIRVQDKQREKGKEKRMTIKLWKAELTTSARQGMIETWSKSETVKKKNRG